MLKNLFTRTKTDQSEALYAAIVAAARQPRFYADWGVPDTMDGRFDILMLHMFLVLDRLHVEGPAAAAFAQALTDRFFASLDAALREAGVGDLTVGKKVRKMAEAFYGRVSAYQASLKVEDDTLRDALARNVFAGIEVNHATDLANWTRLAHAALAKQSWTDLAAGTVRFT
jgi:cytochrome b pre-mRNA-processing protein 3